MLAKQRHRRVVEPLVQMIAEELFQQRFQMPPTERGVLLVFRLRDFFVRPLRTWPLTVATRAEEYDGAVRLHLDGPEGAGVLDVDALLVATGRVSNADGLDLDKAGVEVRDGLVVVDEHQHTTAEGVWALGDVSNRFQLKHVSNHEARMKMCEDEG